MNTTTSSSAQARLGAPSPIAYRLGADPSLKILVLKAGGKDHLPIFKVPLTWGLILRHSMYGWGYFTEPEPEAGMDGRRIVARAARYWAARRRSMAWPIHEACVKTMTIGPTAWV